MKSNVSKNILLKYLMIFDASFSCPDIQVGHTQLIFKTLNFHCVPNKWPSLINTVGFRIIPNNWYESIFISFRPFHRKNPWRLLANKDICMVPSQRESHWEAGRTAWEAQGKASARLGGGQGVRAEVLE